MKILHSTERKYWFEKISCMNLVNREESQHSGKYAQLQRFVDIFYSLPFVLFLHPNDYNCCYFHFPLSSSFPLSLSLSVVDWLKIYHAFQNRQWHCRWHIVFIYLHISGKLFKCECIRQFPSTIRQCEVYYFFCFLALRTKNIMYSPYRHYQLKIWFEVVCLNENFKKWEFTQVIWHLWWFFWLMPFQLLF